MRIHLGPTQGNTF